ncbi:MAG: major capsid protein, partial [Candidatus Dormibacteria bacterium]
APVEADYTFFRLGTPRRPVRDGLVRFGAGRGGIRFIASPHLSDVAPGVSTWTHQTDAAWTPGAATKPFVTVSCGSEIVVQVDFIPLAMVIGNFNRMTFPELWEEWWNRAQVQWARYADSLLLTRLAALCTTATPAQDLGFSRDALVHLGTAGDGYRSRNRMEPDEIIQVFAPFWLLGSMRRDMARQHPVDDAIAKADAEILGYLAKDNIEPVFYLDSPTTGANQVFTAQGSGPLEGYPATAQCFMFAPGSFLHLDGGELNLGTEIRDWTLDQQNQVAAFVETAENVAFKGLEALAIPIRVCNNGWTAAAVATAACSGS